MFRLPFLASSIYQADSTQWTAAPESLPKCTLPRAVLKYAGQAARKSGGDLHQHTFMSIYRQDLLQGGNGAMAPVVGRKLGSFLCSRLEGTQVNGTLAYGFCQSNSGQCCFTLVSKQAAAIQTVDV